MSEEHIELRIAYAWDCPACGHHPNFCEAVTAELTDEERVELRKYVGMESEDWTNPEFSQGVDLITRPNRVTCRKCGASFPVEIDYDALPPGFNPHKDLDGGAA